MNKFEDILNMAKVNEYLGKKFETKKQKKSNKVVWVLAVIAAVAAIAGIAYAIYRYLKPDYLEDFEDDFEEDFEEEDFAETKEDADGQSIEE